MPSHRKQKRKKMAFITKKSSYFTINSLIDVITFDKTLNTDIFDSKVLIQQIFYNLTNIDVKQIIHSFKT
jgi:hypothetical protein